MTAKRFAYQASTQVMNGLTQEIGLWPGRDYTPVGNNSARVVLLQLRDINPHYLDSVRSMQKSLTMWAGLDDKHGVRVGFSGHNILIEIPKPQPYWKQITIETMEARRMIRRGPVATLGMGLYDDPKRINFKEEAMAHVFITGQTRSGKTNAQRLIAWNLSRNISPTEGQLIVFDVAKRGYKWRDFGSVTSLAHPVVTTIEEADAVLTWLVDEINRRAEYGYITPRLFVLIDELKALTDDSKIASPALSRIASVGGEFGLHLILATQYPQIKMLGSAELKRNVTTRLCGKVDDASAATNALGLTGTGAETLQGYGDMLLRDFDGLGRMTVAKIEPSHVAALSHGEIGRLDLPMDGSDAINNTSEPRYHDPDPIEPDQLAMALFAPVGINKFAAQFEIGSPKADRILKFAGAVWRAARQQGYECLPKSHPKGILDAHTG
jgi:FtsK/SpoIIIE family